jgi:hypothetical protein
MCLAPLAACAGRTQVVVRVDADRAVLEDSRYDHLQIEVRALSDPPDGPPRLDEPAYVFPEPAPTPLPFDTVLTPQGGDVSRRYEVVVSAEDADGNAYVSVAAISGYVPNQTRVLHLRLTSDCRDVFCGNGLTCRRSVCESAEIAPLALPALGQPPPDVTAWDGGIADDAGGMIDAGDRDAGDMDAGDMDAGDMDAGVLDASEPDATVPDAGVSFTTTELLTMASSESILHGLSVCSARDGSFMAAAERLARNLALWDDARGARTLSVPVAATAVACRPSGTELLVGTESGIVVRASATRDAPWSEEIVTDPGAMGIDGLGTAVALSGTYGVAGAPARGRGAAVVLDADLASVIATLTSTDTVGVADGFGSSVAISGDGQVIAVGAPQEDGLNTGVGALEDDGSTNTGVVFVFLSTEWGTSVETTTTRIKSPAPVANALFGSSVALDASGTWLAVGAPVDGASTTTGLVFIYRRTGTGWTYVTMLSAPRAGDGDRFGAAVSFSDDASILAVGAPGEDSTPAGIGSPVDEGAPDSGAVYVFRHEGSTWTPLFVKAPTLTDPSAQFGAAVAVAGDGRTVFIGAPATALGGFGAVYRLR